MSRKMLDRFCILVGMVTVAYEIGYQFSPAEVEKYARLARRVQEDPGMSVLRLNLACMGEGVDWDRFMEWWLLKHEKNSDTPNQ
ncbi:MAG TPA: hypothetical protein DCX25_00915 [Candidatus Pacebacteria bacterium]|nr:hypothetical protein [Candidatus Paceibacterota bacterium]